jgi:hypothetical protein
MRLFIAAVLLVGGSVFAANPVSKMYDDQLTLVETNVLGLAQAMPADKYDFAPSGGALKGVRTFGEQVRHVATMIYMTAAISMQEKSPFGPGAGDNGPANLHSKEEILRYLEDSIKYARRAIGALTEQNQLDPLPTVFGSMPRAGVIAGIAYHSFDHYGQMVIYARMNGIVPPASVPSRNLAAPAPVEQDR